MTFLELFEFVQYFFGFNMIEHAIYNVSKEKNLPLSEISLSFSFEKTTFDNFRCNFDDRVLSSAYLKQKPFYISKPVRNFLKTFSLFFLYSQVKNSEEFKNIVEKLFKNSRKLIFNIVNESGKFNYDSKTFEVQLNKIYEDINKMIVGNGSGIVFIEERDGRIFVTKNKDSSEDFNPHFLNSFLNLKLDTSGNGDIKNAMIKYYTKLQEIYLEGLLETDFIASLNDIYGFERRNKRYIIELETEVTKNPKVELLNLFSNYCQLVNYDSRTAFKGDYSKFAKNFSKYNDLYIKMHLCSELPIYLEELIQKGTSKYYYEYSEVNIKLNNFFKSYSLERNIIQSTLL